MQSTNRQTESETINQLVSLQENNQLRSLCLINICLLFFILYEY